MKTILAVAALLLSAACSPAGEPDLGPAPAPAPQEPAEDASARLTRTWTVDDRFTAEELESIVAAGDGWRSITRGRADLSLVVGPVDGSTPFAIVRGELPDDCCAGLTNSSLDRITIDADEFAGDECVGRLWHVAAHEMGHALGILEHGGDGLMRFKKPSCDAAFTKADLEMFESANP